MGAGNAEISSHELAPGTLLAQDYRILYSLIAYTQVGFSSYEHICSYQGVLTRNIGKCYVK